MYHILIVDDERIEREGIIYLLKMLGIELKVSQAVNGQKALELLKQIQEEKKQKVDILLTDVKMPFMDGIELIRQIKELGISLKSIIFSGYNEFEYAKLAVKLGVSDYILKPVDPQEFKTTLQKVIDEMNEQQQQQETQEKRDGYMREYLLYSLVNGANPQLIQKQSEQFLGTKFWNEYQRILLVEFKNDFFGKVSMDFQQELLKKLGGDFRYLNLNQQQALVFMKDTGNDLQHAVAIAEAIHEKIAEQFDVPCYIAISNYLNEYSELSGAMEQLDNLMENRFYQTQTYIYGDNWKQQDRNFDKLDDDTLVKQMQQDIRMKDMLNLKKHFERLCARYQNKTNFSQIYIKFMFSNLLKEICDQLPEMDEEQITLQIEKLYQASDFQTVQEVLQHYIEELNRIFANYSNSSHREIEVIKQYIYTHYQEEIGVDGLASMVYLAPSYLSSIFKKETGQNLSKFIKQYRMEKAKDMLEHSNKKIVNISNEVGYPNVSYFCQSFRECFGVSPQKYRTDGTRYA